MRLTGLRFPETLNSPTPPAGSAGLFAIMSFPAQPLLLGDGVMATLVALDHAIGVRIPVPQPRFFLTMGVSV